MLSSTILLLIASIIFLAVLIAILIVTDLINWQSILIIIALALLLAGLIWLAQITDFFTNWNIFSDNEKFKIIASTAELIF